MKIFFYCERKGLCTILVKKRNFRYFNKAIHRENIKKISLFEMHTVCILIDFSYRTNLIVLHVLKNGTPFLPKEKIIRI